MHKKKCEKRVGAKKKQVLKNGGKMNDYSTMIQIQEKEVYRKPSEWLGKSLWHTLVIFLEITYNT